MSRSLQVRVAPRTWVHVATLAEASAAVRRHLEAGWIGASAWGQESAPVRDAAGRTVARVSFNGRVWTPERDWRERREIPVGRPTETDEAAARGLRDRLLGGAS